MAFKTPKEYIDHLPEDRQKYIKKLRTVIRKNIPKGFKETIQYGMIGYVVPLSAYPAGYLNDPKQPLPFINLASQKSHIAIYHSGVYADDKLKNWFEKEYAKHVKTKLNMGKSCIRFKNPAIIPYDLIGELVSKMTMDEWINIYKKNKSK
jgi:uncharacterized protein YdhG (YjbR/CyaY superfamily)